jgi:hypothetical protein
MGIFALLGDRKPSVVGAHSLLDRIAATRASHRDDNDRGRREEGD